VFLSIAAQLYGQAASQAIVVQFREGVTPKYPW